MTHILQNYIKIIKAFIVLQDTPKVLSEKFMKLFNNEDIGINTDHITIDEITYNMYNNNYNYRFEYTIRYNKTHKKTFSKILSKQLYEKIKKDGVIEYYLVFLYGIINFDSGQFWGIDPKIYKLIQNRFPRSIECFASPFNNNLPDYYSVLYPIDQYYGSKGNFFDEFAKSNYDAYVLNPPFVETIIQKTLNMIIEKLNTRPNTTIIFYIPTWDDLILPWYNTLPMNIYKEKCLLDIDKSYVFDYIKYKRFMAKFATYFIYLTNGNPNKEFNKLLCNMHT